MQDGSFYIGASHINRVRGLAAQRVVSDFPTQENLSTAAALCRNAKQAIQKFHISPPTQEEHGITQSASMQSIVSSLDDVTSQLSDVNAPTSKQERELTTQRDSILELLVRAESYGDKNALHLMVKMELVYTYTSTEEPTTRDSCVSLDSCARSHLETYSQEHWEGRVTELKELHNDMSATIETRCWAKLMRAKVLLHLSVQFPSVTSSHLRPKRIDPSRSNKAKLLCFQLSDMLTATKCSSADALEILKDAQLFSRTHAFEAEFMLTLPRLPLGQRKVQIILITFLNNNFQEVINLAAAYVKRNKADEKVYRHIARYLWAVAQYFIFYQDNDDESSYTDDSSGSLKTQASSVLTSFISHYNKKDLNLINREACQENAKAYLNKLKDPMYSCSVSTAVTVTVEALPERGITAWHFDFDTTLRNDFSRILGGSLSEVEMHDRASLSVGGQNNFYTEAATDSTNSRTPKSLEELWTHGV